MKKLMIAAAIVCAAAMSQASTFVWSSTDKAYGPDLTKLVVGHMDPGTANAQYMKTEASSVAWTFVMTLGSGDNTDVVSGSITSSDFSSNKIKVQGLDSDLIPDHPATPTTVPYSIIITGKYTDANEKEWTLTSDAITGNASYSSVTTTDLKTGAPAGWNVTSTDVPEPTSGLLLLLGVAGLALRRRRA